MCSHLETLSLDMGFAEDDPNATAGASLHCARACVRACVRTRVLHRKHVLHTAPWLYQYLWLYHYLTLRSAHTHVGCHLRTNPRAVPTLCPLADGAAMLRAVAAVTGLRSLTLKGGLRLTADDLQRHSPTLRCLSALTGLTHLSLQVSRRAPVAAVPKASAGA